MQLQTCCRSSASQAGPPVRLMAVALAMTLLMACDLSYQVDGRASSGGTNQPAVPNDDAGIDAANDLDAPTIVDLLPPGDVLPAPQEPPEHGTGSFLQVATGAGHACGVKQNGEIACWGSNFTGESIVNFSGGSYKQVVAGNALSPPCVPPQDRGRSQPAQCGFSCALGSTDEVRCWGDQTSGVASPPMGEKFFQIAAGAFPCGLRYDGRAVCWGPAPPAPPDVFTQISVGAQGSVCGLKENGEVLCWGSDLGPTPKGAFTQLSVGASFACGLAADTSISCWPSLDWTAVPPAGPGFSAVSVGWEHACAVQQGVVTCWGDFDSFSQQKVPPVRFASVSAGRVHTCALEPNGGVMCWGMVQVSSRRFKKLSATSQSICGVGLDGAVLCWGHSAPYPGVPPLVPFQDVSTSFATTCGVQSDGELNCWGAYLQAGADEGLPAGAFQSVKVATVGSAEVLVGAIRADGTLAAWENEPGFGPWRSLLKLPASGRFTDLAVSSFGYLCALAEDGSVGCWDRHGALATPTGTFVHLLAQPWGDKLCAVATDQRVLCWNPFSVLESSQLPGSFVEVALGIEHGCGRGPDGKISCWGLNTKGQASPPSGSFVQISAGFDHTCALDSERRPWCWGDYVIRPL